MGNSRKEEVSQQVGGPVLNLSSGMDLENLHGINSKPDCSQSLRWDYAKTLLPEAMHGKAVESESDPCYTCSLFSAIHDEGQLASLQSSYHLMKILMKYL